MPRFVPVLTQNVLPGVVIADATGRTNAIGANLI